MRIFTLLIALLLGVSSSMTAQRFFINSPPSVEGAYSFTFAEFGAQLADTVITADVVFTDDGTALPTEGCNPPVNGADMAGKWVMIDRGSCEFGVKCLNVENAGAAGAIVFNNIPNNGHIIMGAGAVGGQVTIPCVMLSYEDGQLLRNALANGDIEISVGNIVVPNDIGTAATAILNAPNGVAPSSQFRESGSFVFTPGAEVTNFGSNDATGATLHATIIHTPQSGIPVQLYDESASIDMIPVDSAELIVLPDFDAGTFGFGRYDVSYSLSSDSTDQIPFNDAVTTGFNLSNNIYCKAGWNEAENRPNNTIGYTVAGGGAVEFLSPFFINDPTGVTLDSLQFLVSTSLAELTGVYVSAYVYNWDDANADEAMTSDELSIIGFADNAFGPTTETAMWLKLPIIDFELFEEGVVLGADNQRIMVGVRYEGVELVFFGFDQMYNQFHRIELLSNANEFSDLDYSYLGVQAWNSNIPDIENAFTFTDEWASVGTALFTNEVSTKVTDIDPINYANVTVYPNPTSDVLVTEVELLENSDYLLYQITDAMGRVIKTIRQASPDLQNKLELNVSGLMSGTYFMNIRSPEGMTTKSFTVK